MWDSKQACTLKVLHDPSVVAIHADEGTVQNNNHTTTPQSHQSIQPPNHEAIKPSNKQANKQRHGSKCPNHKQQKCVFRHDEEQARSASSTFSADEAKLSERLMRSVTSGTTTPRDTWEPSEPGEVERLEGLTTELLATFTEAKGSHFDGTLWRTSVPPRGRSKIPPMS